MVHSKGGTDNESSTYLQITDGCLSENLCLPACRTGRSVICTIFFLLISIPYSFSQKEANIWYFGWQAGIDFNSGSPVALTNSSMKTDEGCASIADANGNLLFYTNGAGIWDKTHAVMPNGFGLMGASSSSQSALIVPKPGSPAMYYVFTAPVYTSGGLDGVRYSEVDMTLASGNGDVIASTKNTLLFAPATEQLCGVSHSNGTDVWVIARANSTNDIYAYLVTNAGIASPVISSCGQGFNSNFWGGYLKASPNGSKLASALVNLPEVEIYNFNNTTGAVSYAFSLPNTPHSYAVSFSSDNSRLYVETGVNNVVSQSIYQYNMCAGNGDKDSVIASRTLVSPKIENYGAIQLAPDGKMYITRYTLDTLSVINNPNALGTACNFVNSGFPVIGSMSPVRHGLPNFIETILSASPSLNLGNDTTLCSGPLTLNVGNSAWTNYLWSTGETTQSINVNTSGTYWVNASNNGCTPFSGSDTIKVTFLSASAYLGNDTALCAKSFTLTANSGGNYLWSTNATTQSITIVSSGTYWVQLSNGNCSDTDTINVTLHAPPVVNTGPDITITEGSDTTLTATGGGNYTWSPSSGLSCVTCQNPVASPSVTTVYCVKVIDTNGCSDSGCVTVTVTKPLEPIICVGELYLPNTFSPNNDGENDNLQIYYGNLKCITAFTLIIYDRWGENIYETTDPSFTWDGIYEGKPLSTDVFAYYLEATFISGEIISKKGNISMIR